MQDNELAFLPSDEAIEMMNKEYNELARRQELTFGKDKTPPLPTSNFLNDGMTAALPQAHSRPNFSPKDKGCDLNQKKLFERIYFAEQDMIMALKQLFTIAPQNAKDDISDLIKLKKDNSKNILKCYYANAEKPLSYTPILPLTHDFCRLLQHILNLQKHLLLMLNKAKFACRFSKQLINAEWTASYILSTIGIFCKM